MTDHATIRIVNQGSPHTTEVSLGADQLTAVLTLDFTGAGTNGVVSALVRLIATVDLYATYDGQVACAEWAILQQVFPQIGPLPRAELARPYVHIVAGGPEARHCATMLTALVRPDGAALQWIGVEKCHADPQIVHATLRYPWMEADTPLEQVGQYADELRLLIQGMTYREVTP